jgi:hypothetical protein
VIPIVGRNSGVIQWMPTLGSRLRCRGEPHDGAVAPSRHGRAQAERRRLDARERARALEELRKEGLPAIRTVGRTRQIHADGEQPLRGDPDARPLQPLGAPNHQARARQQDQRKRDLRRHQHRAGVDPPAAACRFAPRLQRVDRAQHRRLRGRQQRHEECGHERHSAREEQRHGVETDHRRADARQARGSHDARRTGRHRGSEEDIRFRQQQSGSHQQAAGNHQTAQRAEARQQQTLREELPDDAPAARADGDADGDFTPSRHRLRRDEIGEVHARDEQHEPHGAQDDDGGTADVGVHARRVHRVGDRAPAGHADVLARERRVNLAAQHAHGGRGRLLRDCRLAARHDRVRM